LNGRPLCPTTTKLKTTRPVKGRGRVSNYQKEARKGDEKKAGPGRGAKESRPANQSIGKRVARNKGRKNVKMEGQREKRRKIRRRSAPKVKGEHRQEKRIQREKGKASALPQGKTGRPPKGSSPSKTGEPEAATHIKRRRPKRKREQRGGKDKLGS